MENEIKIKTSSKKLLITAFTVIAVFVVAYFAVYKSGMKIGGNESAEGVKTSADKYQAVFLTNGQVYFGKLSDNGGNYVKLNDIYYLQAQDQVQPKENEADNQESNLTLIKLGKELHAPADEMNISRQQMLFWEDIEADGKVMKAIEDYKSQNN